MKLNYRLNVYKNNELIYQSFGEYYKTYSTFALIAAKQSLPKGFTHEIVKIKEKMVAA